MVALLKQSKLRVFMLCGYMLDTVFQTLPDPPQYLDFLLNELLTSLTQRKKKKDLATAYQALETLQMTTGSDAFGERIVANFDHVITTISAAVNEIKSP